MIDNTKGITLVALVVTITVLIILAGVSISATLGENGIITIAKQAKQNIEQAQIQEQIELNELYTQIEGNLGDFSDSAIESLIEFKKIIAEAITKKGVQTKPTDSATIMANNIASIKTETPTEGTAVPSDILSEKTAWVNAKKLTGTMKNNGAQTANLNAGGSYTIPEGYHNGSGRIIANSLASQTGATATAGDILLGKTAWVNGNKVTGNMANNGAINVTLNAGGSYTIPEGYHNGSGRIIANSLASQTGATAVEGDILSGKTAWVNGSRVTGNMPNIAEGDGIDIANSAVYVENGSKGTGIYTRMTYGAHLKKATSNYPELFIPKELLASSLANQTSATATAADIAAGKTAWVNGVKITGTRPAPVKLLTGTVTRHMFTGEQDEWQVTFSTPFDKVPTISLTSNWPSELEGRGITSVTRTGFTVNQIYYNSNEWHRYVDFQWRAEV